MSDADDGFASPPCSLHEAGDAYLGYFTHAEVAVRLGTLRVAAHALTRARNDTLRVAAAQWSATLAVHLVRLKAAPPPARNLSETEARAEMIHLLDLLIPKVRDDVLHAELRGIREALVAFAA